MFAQQRGRIPGEAAKKSVSARVDSLHSQLRHAQALSNASAKQFEKDRVQRQWVRFMQWTFRTRLEEVLAEWKGEQRWPEGGSAGSGQLEKPVPFKDQVLQPGGGTAARARNRSGCVSGAVGSQGR